MAGSTSSVDVRTVLDDLVKQFADPMAFFRELIQNAIDAGSGEVDIRMEFTPDAEGGGGLMIVHVDDFGEGMTREIIETKLTRLFSSGKDNDYTKIGRFGIGFVSVFAIEPEAVCVDTGRTGESWRVLFDADRTFELIRLDRPQEGTQIQIIKSLASQEAFDEFERRAREVVVRWCKHASIPIYVQGAEIGQSFDVDALCKVRHEEEGTRVVMGLVPASQAPYGFYNRGLTLKEGEESPWPHVELKIDSRYLEHTLTRDQVLQDKNFHKAQQLLQRLAEEELPAELFASLERAAADPRAAEEHEQLVRLLRGYLAGYGELDRALRRRPILPQLYGPPVSLQEVEKRADQGALYAATERSHITDALQGGPQGGDLLFLRARDVGQVARLLDERLQIPHLRHADAHFVLAQPTALSTTPGAADLVEHTRHCLQALGGAPGWIGFGALRWPSSAVAGRMAVILADRARPQAVSELTALDARSLRGQGYQLLLNADHEIMPKLLAVARREPEWAAFTLSKMLLLEAGLSAEDDSLLALAAVERRGQRLGSPS